MVAIKNQSKQISSTDRNFRLPHLGRTIPPPSWNASGRTHDLLGKDQSLLWMICLRSQCKGLILGWKQSIDQYIPHNQMLYISTHKHKLNQSISISYSSWCHNLIFTMRTWWPKPQRDVWIPSLAETRCVERPLMGSNGFGNRPLLVTSTTHHFWLEFWSFTNFSKQSCMYRDRWSRHLDRKDMIDSDLWMNEIPEFVECSHFRLWKI